MVASSRIIDSRHPSVFSGMADWNLWRTTYRGGEEFRNAYLQQFTNREDATDFKLRREITPIPTFAKAALNDVRNSIFQRMRDILRRGGSEAYQRAVAGLDLGVDRRGSTMNAFFGMKLLTELLVMGRVGVYVDNPVVPDVPTQADANGVRPYVYKYDVEDILNWSCSKADEPSEFQSVLLRDTVMQFDQRTMLPTLTTQRHRLLWIDKATGYVMLQFYDLEGNEIGPDGQPSIAPIQLQLRRIPFVMMDIGDSLLKDVCYHQIALLNLVSSDVNYALKANFPFLVEQRDLRAHGSHLKPAANADGTASTGGQGASDTNIKVGVTHGRAYDKDMNAPEFISPSSEPLRASLELQGKLEDDIRKLINLAVASLGAKASAESKAMDNQGLEAGLSYIGLVLESGERQVAEHWAAYENREVKQRRVATIKYPDRYSLKTDADRIQEASKLSELMYAVPGRTVKREIAKLIVTALLGGKVDVSTVEDIEREIDNAPYTTSDPKIIVEAKNAGLVGEKTASIALGFNDDEFETAREDHVARILRIAEAQSSAADKTGGDPAARGIPDLSPDPANAGKDEKELSRNTDLQDTTAPRVRGAGKDTAVEE
jgi:hypothetical protein